MIRAAENYTVRVRGDFWIRAKRPVKGGLKNLVETMISWMVGWLARESPESVSAKYKGWES